MNAEQKRLQVNEHKNIPLEPWGPYMSERQWGTVREDYSEHGDAWGYFPFEHAYCRAYRWGEDGIAGISDFYQNLCFALSLWNGKDPILKERLFGLGNYQGNHGEDVKELYYYLDNLPTHYYMEYLYKYPQQAFPYEQLKAENRSRSRLEPEYEILDTGVFDENRYFDVHTTYAKHHSTDTSIRIRITNQGPETAELTVLPTLWFYNRWQYDKFLEKPVLSVRNPQMVRATHKRLGSYYFYFEQADDLLMTENETNWKIVTGRDDGNRFTKDAFHRVIVDGENPKPFRRKRTGTKCAPVYRVTLQAGETRSIILRLSHKLLNRPFDPADESVFDKRKAEADDFYDELLSTEPGSERYMIQRQAIAGLLWSKQYYHYDVERWLNTTDGITPVSKVKQHGRNHDWKHLKNQDIISMPDKWEFPWYAAWDLAFQCIPLAFADPCFAKNQLLLIMREWYMKPDGQLPAYEWNFSDVNPPVQAWAALQVYYIEKEKTGRGDIEFLKKIFHKLLINFTWWINRKDPNGNNMFEGGFLGLDNIGVFNRSSALPGQVSLEQADGTAWMGMYALNMLDIALEIAMKDAAFEDTATKFFEQFVLIAEALNEHGMWNQEDGFFYDMLVTHGAQPIQLKIQSVVGLTSLFAVSVIQKRVTDKLHDFSKRISWFENYRLRNGLFWPNEEHSEREETLLSLIPKDRLVQLLKRILSESEFLSPTGLRALSKYHEKHPYTVHIEGTDYTIRYDPGDSTSDFFGGNSNWRGPVWIPMNYLIIKSIRQYGEFYDDHLKVECPTGSGNMMNLDQVADELTRRLVCLFERNTEGLRPAMGEYGAFYAKPENSGLLLFHEYFHGDTGNGLGASHQTGWTALIADLVEDLVKAETTSRIHSGT
jgi:hypothetical protein